jgi:hypothetical protein
MTTTATLPKLRLPETPGGVGRAGQGRRAERVLRARRPEDTGLRRHSPPGGGEGLTLGTQLAGVWEGLLTTGAAECPVCGGAMSRLEGSGACSGCGSLLS